MGILNLKWINYDCDPDLRKIREFFTEEYPDVEMGKIYPDNYRPKLYKDYYFQIKPKDFPAQVHFEYWSDRWQGFMDLHLEPNRNNPDEMKVFHYIGIQLMHMLSERGIECLDWWGLPYGRFRVSGIHNVDEFIDAFKFFYECAHEPLLKIYNTKKGAQHLQLKYPKKNTEYRRLQADGEDVTVRIMTLSEIMGLNLILPEYQREYCWEDKNIADLWHNLKKIKDGSPYHLGTIILHDYNNSLGIIDGQQRLITLTMMLLAMEFDGYLPLLNESYDSTDAREHVANCKYLVQSLVSKEKNISDLLKRIKDNITFAVLTVNEANLDLAYTFFSNQNSKGVPLSDFDLLKAHHLRFIPNDDQAEHMAVKWNKLTMLPPIYKEKNALFRTLGTHIYRLRRWMRKNKSHEGHGHYIQHEYQSAATLPDVPPFGEKFDFYEKIQGGTHFFVYAETFINRYLEFLQIPLVGNLHRNLAWGSYERYSDVIETVLYAYYLKFGRQYLAEALYCISQLAAIYRYNEPRDASDGSGIRSFIGNDSELVLMIDQASSPTFFLAEALAQHVQLPSKKWKDREPIMSGVDLPEIKGIKWGMYKALQAMNRELLPEITESTIRNLIIEEYGK